MPSRRRQREVLVADSPFVVTLDPCPEGGFHVSVPSLPGCHSQGETEDDALEAIREAIALYLDDCESTDE